MFAASKTAGASGVPSDPYFYDVSLLLNGDGTNGAQNNTFLDSSTNNFTITRNGNTTQGSFSPYGNLWSNYFNGSSGNYLVTPNSSGWDFGSGAFTIECWVNMAQYINGGGESYTDDWITSLWDGSTGYWVLRVGSGGSSGSALRFTWNNFSSNVFASTDLPLNSWVHLVVACNGSTISLFQNGTRVATTSISGITSSSGGAPVYIGNINNYNRPFNGYISNLRIVKGTDVYGATNTTLTVPTAPLTAISGTQLLTCEANRFIDNSSNNFAITANGTPSVQRFSPFNPTAPYSTTTIGGSGYFDGSSYLSYSGTTVGLGAMTFECWFYYTGSFSGIQSLIGPGSAITGGLGCNIVNATTVSFDAYGIVGTNYTVPTIVPNTWNHIAFVRNSSNVETVFLNGVRSSTGTQTDAFTYTTVAAIGYTGGAVPRNFNGNISNARLVVGSNVYDPTQTTITVPTAPLTAIANTQLLCNMVNAGIPDLAMQNDLQTVGSAQVSTSVKKYGTGSLSFNGSGSYLLSNPPSTADYAFGTGAFTIEFWVNFNSISGNPQIISFNPTSTTGAYPLIYIGGSNTFAWYVNNGEQITGTTTPSTGSWYHVAICRSGTSTKLFVNGTQEGSTYSDSSNYLCGANRPAIGCGGYNLLNQLNGYIDDLRITNGYARYTSNFTPPTAALPTY